MPLLTSRRLHLLLIALALMGPGCSGKDPNRDREPDDDGHTHGPGPHKGVVFDFGKGGKIHAEFTVDHPSNTVKVYILGRNQKTPLPIDAKTLTLSIKDPKFSLELKPEPQKDDPEGKASCFVAKDDRFGKEQEFAGSLTGDVDGIQKVGDFEEKPGHGHEKK
jgi:hypothetical protein